MNYLKIEPATRPYSDKELSERRFRTRKWFRLGNVHAEHPECGHVYFTRLNSSKEKDIVENNDRDSGNCSVCWNLSKMHPEFIQEAQDLIRRYNCVFRNEDTLTYESVMTEYVYYSWLFGENLKY